MAPPAIALFAILAAKKAIGVSLYMAGKRYGWPRVYRRIAEVVRDYAPKGQQRGLRAVVKSGIKLPGQLVNVLHNSEIVGVARKYVSAQRSSGTAYGWAIGWLGDELLSRSPEDLAREIAAAAAADEQSRRKDAPPAAPPMQ